LEEQKRRNVEMEKRDGMRRHFEFDWSVGEAANERYGRFVRGEITRLGRDHPLIRTQYFLECLGSGGGFFTMEQRLLLQGTHPRERAPVAGTRYVAAVDVAGAAEEAPDVLRHGAATRKDSTVVGIARVQGSTDGSAALTHLVEIYWWTGRPLYEQCERLIHLLRDVWRCGRIVVDATGLGADLAARLERACGRGAVEPFVFSVQSKSRLAYHLVSHVDAGRLQMWAEPDAETRRHGDPSLRSRAGAGSPGTFSAEAAEFWKEVELVRPVLRSGGLLGFAVPAHQGHDDFVSMLALLSWAAREVRPAPAHALLAPRPAYEEGGKYE
jgi:hypothetical protein